MLKLSELDPKLRRRITDQVAREDARRLGAVGRPERKQNPQPALDCHPSPKQSCGPCVAVCIISLRRRLLDDDNNQGENKHLRDQIARSLQCDDGDPRIQWHYRQLTVAGSEGSIVMIETL